MRILITFFVFIAFAGAKARADDYAKFFKLVSPCSVAVIADGYRDDVSDPKKTILRHYGSGFVYEKNGYIATSYHVIKDSDNIIILSHDNVELPAKVVGFDEEADIALLRVDATDMGQCLVRSYGSVRTGDRVFTVGNPLGLNRTFNTGIVSARARLLKGMNFIQTNLGLNVGDSGSPLFNSKGEIIGINVMMVDNDAQNGGYGISFAVPSDAMIGVLGRIKRGLINEVKIKPLLGIFYYHVDDDTANMLKMPHATGVFIHDISAGSSADVADVRSGDVVLSINGIILAKNISVASIVEKHSCGDILNLTIWRDGNKLDKQITLCERAVLKINENGRS